MDDAPCVVARSRDMGSASNIPAGGEASSRNLLAKKKQLPSPLKIVADELHQEPVLYHNRSTVLRETHKTPHKQK